MSTIRQRLTVRLLIGLVLLLLVGGSLGYWLAAAALTRQFDELLRAKATSMAMLIEEEDGGHLDIDATDVFLREFEPRVGAAFFQLWDCTSNVVRRSKSLRDSNLPLTFGTLSEPKFLNLSLSGGVHARVATIKFTPRPTDDAKPPAVLTDAILAVALDRHDLNQTLTILRLVLTTCGTLILVLTASLMPVLLRKELAPVNRLGDQAQGITSASLSSRFPVEELPGELKPISSKLNDLLQRLETAFNRERQFSDDLAHEFRTPLAELRSLTELSLKWPDTHTSQTDQQTLAIVVQMQNVVDRLLAIARSEQGGLPARLEKVDLVSMVNNVRQSLTEKISARQIRVELSLVPGIELGTDPVLLRSILSNLLENAVEYAPQGSPVRLVTAAQADQFNLTISNAAEHLNPEDIAHLFDRFWRKDKARTRSVHVGLGLSLARASAQALGYMLIASLEGQGWLVMRLSGPIQSTPL
ncbi:MAG: ATP-binding protein [Verrucomicrobiota bacterium]